MIKNTRYPEGSIAEQYLVHECVGYCKLYLATPDDPPQVDRHFDISVYSNLVKPSSFLRRMRLSREEIDSAHWCVLQNCEEVRYFMDEHEEQFYIEFPNGTNEDRIKQFPQYLLYWVNRLEGTDPMYSTSSPLYSLACQPLAHSCYSKCQVNGIIFLTWQRDQNRQTQNSGLMVEAGGLNYYGVLEEVIELKYNMDMPVVVFRCRWFNTYDPLENATLKTDRYGLISVDTSGSHYEDTPYCLATTARQVFYLDDPVLGDNWKVVQMVSHRGVYSDNALGRREAYQELAPHIVPTQCLNDDFGNNDEDEVDDDEDEVDDDEDEIMI